MTQELRPSCPTSDRMSIPEPSEGRVLGFPDNKATEEWQPLQRKSEPRDKQGTRHCPSAPGPNLDSLCSIPKATHYRFYWLIENLGLNSLGGLPRDSTAESGNLDSVSQGTMCASRPPGRIQVQTPPISSIFLDANR